MKTNPQKEKRMKKNMSKNCHVSKNKNKNNAEKKEAWNTKIYKH